MEFDVDDVTDDLRRYRDALRLLWNEFIRGFPDSEHSFANVQDSLFDAMIGYEVRFPEPRLRIQPVRSREGSTARLGHLQDGSMHWPLAEIPETWDLRFHDFFDWATFDGEYRHFEYVEVRVANWSEVGLQGEARVLLDPTMIRAFAMYPNVNPT
jgi:hypothetical protein